MFVLSGWLTLIGVLSGSLFYLWNLLNPAQTIRRVQIHGYIGLTSLIPLLIHVLSLPDINYINWMIWTGVGFFLIILGTGVTLLYIPEAGWLRYHARSIHPALLVGLLLIILYHLF